jgi:hypothetical protein
LIGVCVSFETLETGAASMLTALLLGGLMGLLGQGIRAIVGLKSMVDLANATAVAQDDVFRAARLLVSLMIGFIAGVAATLALGPDKLSGQTVPIDLLLGIAAAGYAGTDFIEGFMSQYLPGGRAGAPAQQANARYDEIRKELDDLNEKIAHPQRPTPSAPGRSSPRAVFRAKAPIYLSRLMQDFSLTDFQAAGVMGNLGLECNGFTEMQETNPQGGGLGGYGWAQWTGPRRRQFLTWCKSCGLSADDDEANYGFLKSELSGEYSSVIRSLKATTSLDEAVLVFENEYEKPGVPATDRRISWAEVALDAFHSKIAA